MKFKVGETTYTAASLDELTLKMVLELEQESAELGRVLHLADIQAMANRIDSMKTDQQRGEHPDAPWVIAVTVWASRRLAGEKLTFSEAVDVPMKDLVFLKEPQDHKRPANPTKRPAKVSGRAAKPRAGSAAKT